MGLFYACLPNRYPDKYELNQYVVHLCGKSSYCALADVIITRVGQGYITSGTGLSRFSAGRSINPALYSDRCHSESESRYRPLVQTFHDFRQGSVRTTTDGPFVRSRPIRTNEQGLQNVRTNIGNSLSVRTVRSVRIPLILS